jgi:hypothetical protein
MMMRVHRLSGWLGGAMAIVLTCRGAAGQAPDKASASAQPAPTPPDTGSGASTGSGAPADKGAQSTDQEAKPAGPTGGYSWGEKPRKRARRTARLPRHDPAAPLVTFPGFRLRPDGTSVIWVTLSRRSRVEVSARGRIVSFHLPGVYVDVRNNTNPLVTSHFATPVLRTRLRPDKDGASLIVELREPLTPTHRVLDGPRGTMVLEVTVPASSAPASRRAASSSTMMLNSGSPPSTVPAQNAPRKPARAR